MEPRQNLLSDLQERVLAMLRASPAGDLERNLKALLAQAFDRMELVSRDEFDIQCELLARARARIDALEQRIDELERQRPSS